MHILLLFADYQMYYVFIINNNVLCDKILSKMLYNLNTSRLLILGIVFYTFVCENVGNIWEKPRFSQSENSRFHHNEDKRAKREFFEMFLQIIYTQSCRK